MEEDFTTSKLVKLGCGESTDFWLDNWADAELIHIKEKDDIISRRGIKVNELFKMGEK